MSVTQWALVTTEERNRSAAPLESSVVRGVVLERGHPARAASLPPTNSGWTAAATVLALNKLANPGTATADTITDFLNIPPFLLGYQRKPLGMPGTERGL
jgi:hypothetical protein